MASTSARSASSLSIADCTIATPNKPLAAAHPSLVGGSIAEIFQTLTLVRRPEMGSPRPGTTPRLHNRRLLTVNSPLANSGPIDKESPALIHWASISSVVQSWVGFPGET